MKGNKRGVCIIGILLVASMNFGFYIGKPKCRDVCVKNTYIKGFQTTNGPVDINAADGGLLIKVDGIGPITAENILIRRKRLGGKFYNMEDLLSVDGISEKKYKKLKESFYVDKQ